MTENHHEIQGVSGRIATFFSYCSSSSLIYYDIISLFPTITIIVTYPSDMSQWPSLTITKTELDPGMIAVEMVNDGTLVYSFPLVPTSLHQALEITRGAGLPCVKPLGSGH